MTAKRRLSATVDAELLDAGQAAVAAGQAPNLSAWVNGALRRQAEHDRGMLALGDFITAHEADHGVITDEDIAAAERWARARAVVVRPADPPARTSRPRRNKRDVA